VITREQVADYVDARIRSGFRRTVQALTADQQARWFGLLAAEQKLVSSLSHVVRELLGVPPARAPARRARCGRRRR
jgi:hypothetical protein